jgi:transcriptional regulator with XRE-family HTH domain
VLLIARRQAGLSQGELARRLGVARETVARWENAMHEPSFETLQRAVDECGLQLAPRIRNRDGSLQVLIADQLKLTPLALLQALLGESDAARCERALRVIAALNVDSVLCGEVGGALLGSPNRPGDGRVDIAVDGGENARVLGDLLELGALPQAPWVLPDGGELAVLVAPAGTHGARDLRRDALAVILDASSTVLVAHPRDLLRIAYASPDDRDQAMAPSYAALLDVLSSQPIALTG